MSFARIKRVLPALWLCFGSACPAVAAQPKVPEGFEVVTVASVPAVNFPSQLATAPDGSLFVAEDPMDQVGPYEADMGRILVFRGNQQPFVYAQGFRAIFGMAWHNGELYVMNMPRLSVVRDTNGDGVADEVKDILTNLGPGPKAGSLNDHIVSGLQFGMDGYLYISVGDKGVPGAKGPDGRTVQLIGGGIIRCRPDGTGLEVYSSGTRNHLEPNLDARDNLFTYDNTDDGDGWWTRVTHHIDGGYYGYPYDYHDRQHRMLNRMAEYGGGSPCGGLIYKEDAWPEKYRGLAFWAEWGKGKVQAFRFKPESSTFKVDEVIDFAVPDGLENFHPIDLALSYDGRIMYIADWGMGGWGNKDERVGRVFAVRTTSAVEVKAESRGADKDPVAAQIKALAHASFNERMRAQAALIKKGRDVLPEVTAALADPKTDPVAQRHLIWVVDAIAGGTPLGTKYLEPALKSKAADVRAQAARALGERGVLTVVDPLLTTLADQDPTVKLQAVIALGRIGDHRAVPALLPLLANPDNDLAFSVRQALRRIGDWKAVAAGLSSNDAKLRVGILASMELVYDLEAANTLAKYATDAKRPADERAKALIYLSEGHRKTKPWDGQWWGTRPTQGKPPAKVVDWQGTSLAVKTIRQCLTDTQVPVRIAAVTAVETTADRSALAALHKRFPTERDPAVLRAIAQAFGGLDDKDALPLLTRAIRDPKTPEPVRDVALSSIEKIGGDDAATDLVDLLSRSDLAVALQPKVIAAVGRVKAKSGVPILVRKLASPSVPVKIAAAEALGKIGEAKGVTSKLLPLADDRDPAVRKAAITALGGVKDHEAVPALLKAFETETTRFEASLALTGVPDARALQIYLQGLTDKNPDLRKASASAIGGIREQAAPVLEQLATRRELSPGQVRELQKVFTSLQPVMLWYVVGPFGIKDAPIAPELAVNLNLSFQGRSGHPVAWRTVQPTDKGEVDLAKLLKGDAEEAAYAYAEVESATDRPAQIAVGSDDTLTVWINGKQVYDFEESRSFEAEKDRIDVSLAKGLNRILVKCGNHGGVWKFALAVTAPTDYAFLKTPSGASAGFDPEAYRATALKGQGKPTRGRTLFNDPKGIGCIKCHSIGGQGGTIGPELSSVGTKYSRDELITSVLNPSAKISSGYESVTVATADGRVLTGIVKSDTPEALELDDADAKRVRIPKDMIEERKPSNISIMPNGLAEGLSAQDFADLMAYLETLKQPGTTSVSASASGGAKPTRGR
ncbi:MAG TPA: HEAT repeat domain-containing protein [Isosphaeraceae bacterium]|jgi:putative membrane-bound dehydrogenase-like protein|nr:HEAT repeat domain-containing protein [Isosphaeraceae bacterium]